MSKYLYTPYDIALFFECSDFKHGEEKAIRDDLWEKRRAVLPPQDRRDKYRWLRKIEYEQLQFDAIFVPEAESINAALQDIGSRFQLGQADEYNSVEAVFRFIKLRLTYVAACTDVRLKLRTLLRQFGYQRRSGTLVNNIERTMGALRLVPQLRGFETCKIGEIGLDDMIMIRLL